MSERVTKEEKKVFSKEIFETALLLKEEEFENLPKNAFKKDISRRKVAILFRKLRTLHKKIFTTKNLEYREELMQAKKIFNQIKDTYRSNNITFKKEYLFDWTTKKEYRLILFLLEF